MARTVVAAGKIGPDFKMNARIGKVCECGKIGAVRTLDGEDGLWSEVLTKSVDAMGPVICPTCYYAEYAPKIDC